MKTEFSTMSQQMSYINRFIERKTDVKKECIVCGKPATIQHNRRYPFKIRPLCQNCRNHYGLNGHTVDSKPVALPTIDLLDHVITEHKLFVDRKITEDQMKLIDEGGEK